MNPSEAAYFEGNHCQHVAAYHDHLRDMRIAQKQVRRRADREWQRLDGRSVQQLVAADLATDRITNRLAHLHAEWNV